MTTATMTWGEVRLDWKVQLEGGSLCGAAHRWHWAELGGCLGIQILDCPGALPSEIGLGVIDGFYILS